MAIVLIWPWIGLAVVNSAQVQVAVLPSVAVAVLMIVLVALLYLVKQLLAAPSSTVDADEGPIDHARPAARRVAPGGAMARRAARSGAAN